MVTNPARVAARTRVKAAEADLAAAERALPQLLNGDGHPEHTRTPAARRAPPDPSMRRPRWPTRRPRSNRSQPRSPRPSWTRTRNAPDPRLARRGLQMVLRLLAFNAEAWLAEHLNAYLADPDEYRAITRNLLHHGGQIDYTTTGITVTLDRPDTPRIARALTLLTDELNNTPAHLPGDRRPITYQVTPA